MSEYYTDDEVNSAADALADLWAVGLYSGPPSHREEAVAVLDAVAPAIINRLYQQISDTAYAWGYEEFSDFLAGRYNGV